MNDMFCYQCEQTMNGRGCTFRGVCGKSPDTAAAQDALTSELVRLAAVLKSRGTPLDCQTASLIREGLFTCVTNVNFDTDHIRSLTRKASAANGWLGGGTACSRFYLPSIWYDEPEDIRSLKSMLLFGMRGMAAYACHAAALGETNLTVDRFFVDGLSMLCEGKNQKELLDALKQLGETNFLCMKILDHANTATYGEPEIVKVSRTVKPGPFIVVTGHDLRDLDELLEATDGADVNVYTHGEMLPAHGYPALRRHPQLRGNYGTAWQNQQREFDDLPAPILWTTNCLMIPRASYADKVWTTGVVGYPGANVVRERGGHKDFAPLIAAAKAAGGWPETKTFTGVNGGITLTTGCGRATAIAMVPKIGDLVRRGRIGSFMLVGGCDGAKTDRDYYTAVVRGAPKDVVVMTLACGKYRFNDLDLGEIDGVPRLMDFGQCNDAYGAIRFALKLAEEFGCDVNELPLSIILSWYEQKAVAVLLTMLALGLRDIALGPSAPAFVSPGVFAILRDSFGLKMI